MNSKLFITGLGNLWIDGVAKGDLPWEGLLRSGKHNIRVERGPRYVPHDAIVTLKPRESGMHMALPRVAKGLLVVVAGDQLQHSSFFRQGGQEFGVGPLATAAASGRAESYVFRRLTSSRTRVEVELDPGEYRLVAVEALDPVDAGDRKKAANSALATARRPSNVFSKEIRFEHEAVVEKVVEFDPMSPLKAPDPDLRKWIGTGAR